jgi:hypothetical protein
MSASETISYLTNHMPASLRVFAADQSASVWPAADKSVPNPCVSVAIKTLTNRSACQSAAGQVN